ncbi:MAG: 16S rRNA (cytosine(1402)-N(4))-methyltransferase [bacterium]
MTAASLPAHHLPVAVQRAATALVESPAPGQTFREQVLIETNLGDAGHTLAFLQRNPALRIHAFELDPDAIERAAQVVPPDLWKQVTVHHTSFVNLTTTLEPLGLMGHCSAVFCDPGLSLKQATVGSYGFSFTREGPLRMTFDPDATRTAATLLAETTLTDLIATFIAQDIGERDAKTVATAIIEQRQRQPIETTTQFRKLIEHTLKRTHEGKRHVATRYFQALRVAVNDEIHALTSVLPQLLEALAIGGTGMLLSYQGGEAKAMRQFLTTYKRGHNGRQLELLTPSPERSSRDEIRANPAARSALWRLFRRVA